MTPVSLVLILVLMSSPEWAGGLPKSSAQAGQVRFTATLLKDTVRIGEPLLVTCVLKNPTADTQYIPAVAPIQMSQLIKAEYTLLDSQGRSYWPEIWAAIDGVMLSSCCVPVAPGDSIYWRDLLSLGHYSVVDTGPRRWFAQAPGSYRLVTTLQLATFVAGDPFPKGPLSLADTLSFSLVPDSVLAGYIRPYREVLSDGLWSLFTPFTRQQDSVMKSLTPRPANFDAAYPYLDYLIPHALNRVKGRSPEAIAEARRFIESHPSHPLSEEMAFDMWGFFFGMSDSRASQDSLGRVLLKTYPKNTRVQRLLRAH